MAALAEQSAREPRLTVEPAHLNFGSVKLGDSHSIPGASLRITNTGGGVLAGRIVPQVSWIHAEPGLFRCAEGQSSEHIISLQPNTPAAQNNKIYRYNFLALINSNGGSELLGGEYIALPSQNRSIAPPWVWIALPVITIFVLTLAFWGINMLTKSKPTSSDQPSPQMLYTMGAQTMIAQLTLSPPPLPTATSTVEPDLMAPPTSTAAPVSPTYTPWPRNEYPNPEIVVREYYQALNQRNYERAWGMLSSNFQQSCCNKFGNRPFEVYSSWWDTIDQVEIRSAFLQQWDENPSRVNVALRYYRKVGGAYVDTVNVFYLLSDPGRKSLLIDEVK